MRRKLYSFLFLNVFLGLACRAQIQVPENEKLAAFCKVWGFLKYYHPAVSQQKMKWDEVFRSQYKQIDTLNTQKEIKKFYSKWLKNLGDVKDCKTCINNLPDSEKVNLDFDWMNDSLNFDKSTIKEFHYIEKNRNQTKYYIQEEVDGYNAFSKEREYYDSIQPSAELRMMTLARYWNIIQYFYVHKSMITEDWDSLLTAMIPKFRETEDTTAYHGLLLELIAKTNDTYAGNLNFTGYNYYGNLWTPFMVTVLENKAVVSGFYSEALAAKDDIKYGDVIVKINQENIEEVIKQKSKYIAAGNMDAKMRNLSRIICNGDSEVVEIVIDREGTLLTKIVHRYYFEAFNYIENKDTTIWKQLPNNIGYINMGNLKKEKTMDAIIHLRNTGSMILDLRNGCNYNVMFTLTGLLFHEKTPFAKYIISNISYPGTIKFSELERCGQNTNYFYQGTLYILFDEHTQGLDEYMCMALQTAPKARTVGTHTAGAVGNFSRIVLPGGFETSITAMSVLYPDGRTTQGTGIVPEFLVSKSIQGVQNKRDELMDALLEIIKSY